MVPPLQVGIPGAPELLIILLVMLMFLGIPLALVILAVVGGIKLLGGSSDDERVRELERKVERLEAELDRERADDEE